MYRCNAVQFPNCSTVFSKLCCNFSHPFGNWFILISIAMHAYYQVYCNSKTFDVPWLHTILRVCVLLCVLLCRRLFNWFSFILFFYNGFAGFVGAIMRTLLASLVTLALLFRLDRVVLMKGFERFDSGE